MKKLLFVLVCLLMSYSVFADVIEKVDNSKDAQINWTKGTITVIGRAQLIPNAVLAEQNAIERAEAYADANLSKVINKLTIDYVKNINESNNVINDQQKFVSETEIIIKEHTGGSITAQYGEPVFKKINGKDFCVVTATMPIFGENSPMRNIGMDLLGKEKAKIDSVKKEEIKQPEKAKTEVVIAPATVFPVKIEKTEVNQIVKKQITITPVIKSVEGKPYTGVIIDATNFKLQRGMSPKIRMENGDVVWCGANCSFDELYDKGIVAYTSSVAGAKGLKDRVGNNPLVIKAVNIAGNAKCDVVITEADAIALKEESAKGGNFLDTFNVVFVK